MTAPASVPTNRRHRRWIWILAAGLAIHVLLVCWLGERAQPLRTIQPPEPALKLLGNSAAIRHLLESPLVSDPTLFALPSGRGFSGTAWLRNPSPGGQSTDWSELPRWLPLATNELGAAFTDLMSSNKPPSTSLDDLFLPRSSTADILVLNDLLMTQSVVSVEGPLAQRLWVVPIRPFSPGYADVLTNTVLQVRLNPDGVPESVIVVEASGVKAVAPAAVAAVRAARADPASPVALAATPSANHNWGRVVFHWFTVPDVH
jgi:TonB family protein